MVVELTGPQPSERKCWTCKHWKPKDDPAMARLMLVRCELCKAYEFLSPLHSCDQHAPLEEHAVSARRAWLTKVRILDGGSNKPWAA